MPPFRTDRGNSADGWNESVARALVELMKVPMMDRPVTTTPATAREIIQEIVRNMREGLEPLHYSTLAPAIYHVYLHPEDLERLRAIAPRIVDEAKRALDEEVGALNRPSLLGRIGSNRKGVPKIIPPE